MGVIESIRGVMWARSNQPDAVAYVMGASHERFGAGRARAPDGAGREGRLRRRRLQRSPRAVVAAGRPRQPTAPTPGSWLGAAGAATSSISIGTGVTGDRPPLQPGRRRPADRDPGEPLPGPGRSWASGSSEAMNEVPAGMDWPSTRRPAAAHRGGARDHHAAAATARPSTHEGEFFRTREARLYDRPARRPPVVPVRPSTSRAAEVAGRLADGVWTLANPVDGVERDRRLPPRRRGRPGRAPGEIILQAPGLRTATSDDAGSRPAASGSRASTTGSTPTRSGTRPRSSASATRSRTPSSRPATSSRPTPTRTRASWA